MIRKFSIACCLVATLAVAAQKPTEKQPTGPLKDGMGRDYWVYLPKRVEAAKTYWLVVGVHGMGGTGQGAGGFANFATKRDDCIVLGPTFPSDGYQFLQKDSDRQLLDLMATLAQRHRLHPKVFVTGFSGGAQFAHRFAHAYPDKVVGYAAHSAGSWSTGQGWGDINPATRTVPAIITCGMTDTGKMAAQAPFGRLEWAQAYVQQLESRGHAHFAVWIPKTGHQLSPEAIKLTEVGLEVAIGSSRATGADAVKLRDSLKKAQAAR